MKKNVKESVLNEIFDVGLNFKISGNVILEKPIETDADDKFNIRPYVIQLKEACDKGAIYIAVDGKYGSGKSSIVKLLKSELEDEKNIFININFMNINPITHNESQNSNFSKNKEKEKDKDNDNMNIFNDKNIVINQYHRYFVNQVINHICKNPYEFEKLFYNQGFSYATINMKKNTKIKKIIDKLILLLISFISVYTIYGTFLNVENGVYKVVFDTATHYLPILLLITFILLILYGYGFYKPDKNQKSPILDTDKCRNNFLKVIKDYIEKDSTLYFVIDDLDRIKESEIQLCIISLLFNEYYSLDKLIKNVSLKFIFMIDIDKISKENEELLNPQKIFDYILSVSSNQRTILKHYFKEILKDNKNLTNIFNVENSEYFIGLIISKFKGMREIKHIMNKILTKYIYLCNKQIPFDCRQLILLSVLTSVENEENLINAIEYKLNRVDANIDVAEWTYQIIEENIESKIIDKNYYIYIYNFIDESNLFTSTEENIIDIVINTEFNFFTSEKVGIINKYLDNDATRLDYIYDEAYKYIGNNKKIILLGNLRFYNYIKSINLINKDILINSYQNSYIYQFYNNYKEELTLIDKNNIIKNLNEIHEIYLNNNSEENNNKDNYIDVKLEFIKFIKNLKENVLDFNFKEVLSVLSIDEELYDLFINIQHDNHSIIYDLLVKKLLSVNKIINNIDREFMDDIREKNIEKAHNIGQMLLGSSISNELKLYIVINDTDKFDDIEKVYNYFLLDENAFIKMHDLEVLLNKYGYNELLDKYIVNMIDNINFKKNIIDIINANEFNLSNIILKKLDSIANIYEFSNYYNNLFKEKGFYTLLIYSKSIADKKFKLDMDLINIDNYNESLFRVYKNMGKNFMKYDFTKGFTNKIVKNMDFSTIDYNESNFWKIDILIPSLNTYTKCVKIFDQLNDNDMIIKYATYYKNNIKLKNLSIIENLKTYSNEMDASTKGNITKALKKVIERNEIENRQ